MGRIIERKIGKYLVYHYKAHSNSFKYKVLRQLIWVVENVAELTTICIRIVDFIKHSREKLPFTDIFVLNHTVYIVTARPSYWIGEGGMTLDKCEKEIGYKISLVEDLDNGYNNNNYYKG
jgi:hypothetical protein